MGVTRRNLPAVVAEGVTQDTRMSSYGEGTVNEYISGPIALADEGSYFVGVNAAPGTSIVANIATAYSGTASSYVALRNTAPAASTKRIYVDYIKLMTDVVPASATEWKAVVEIDNVLTRFTSGGTVITPKNANLSVTNPTVAALNVGALTTVALSGGGISLGQATLRSVIPVVGDTFVLVFGQKDGVTGSSTLSGTASGQYLVNFPPAIIPAQACLTVSLYGASNAVTGAQFYVQVGWSER